MLVESDEGEEEEEAYFSRALVSNYGNLRNSDIALYAARAQAIDEAHNALGAACNGVGVGFRHCMEGEVRMRSDGEGEEGEGKKGEGRRKVGIGVL